jgi:hypothetical protein
MRSTVVALGLALAIGGLAYGSSRATRAPVPAPVASLAPVREYVASPGAVTKATPPSLPYGLTRPRALRSLAAQVDAAARRHGVPASLVTAVISVESEFNPRAVSRRGALGLMQLMPGTAALLGVQDAFDPAQNVDGGARHLRDLLDRFENDVSLALAAYNAGPQAVIRHGGIPPYPETQAFVARVLSRVGRVTPPAVMVADAAPVEPAAPPPMRVGRPLGERRRPERDGVVIVASLERVGIPPALPAPPARVEPPAAVEAPPVSVPLAAARIESP